MASLAVPARRPRVRVLMMQRDEGALLMDWISHYARLFGMPNLTIMDNGSRDPLTRHLLAHARSLGATIDTGHGAVEDFLAKGLHFARVIRGWDADPAIAGTYDLALPCDCDEFLAAIEPDGITTRTDAVLAALAESTHERRALRIETSLFNVPDRPGWFAVDPGFCKGAIPAGGVDVIDNGQHRPTSSLAPGFAPMRLTYLHWHNRPFDEMRARARQKLGRGLVDPDDPVSLLRYEAMPQAPGRHLVPVLTGNIDWYRRRYDDALRVFVPDGVAPGGKAAGGVAPSGMAPGGMAPGGTALAEGRLLIEDGCAACPWSARDYVAAVPEAAADALGPLHHRLMRRNRDPRGHDRRDPGRS